MNEELKEAIADWKIQKELATEMRQRLNESTESYNSLRIELREETHAAQLLYMRSLEREREGVSEAYDRMNEDNVAYNRQGQALDAASHRITELNILAMEKAA